MLTVASGFQVAGGAEEFCIQRTTGEEEFFEGLADVVGFEFFGAGLKHALGGAAHEFLDEGGRDAIGAFDDKFGDGVRQFKAASVKDGKFAAALGVGKRELDGLVNAAGAAGEGGFKLFGAVGGEDEENSGVFAQAVHFVEEFVEEAFFAGVAHVAAIAGDKVHVFHDDDGGLEKTGESHVFAKDAEFTAGDKEGGVVGKLAGKVMDSVSFASAGRTVKEEAFFHAEFQAAKFGAMADEFSDVAFQEGDGLFWQDDFIALDGAEFMHTNGVGFAGVGALRFEGENFAPIAAALGDGFLDAGHELAGVVEAGLSGRDGNFHDDAVGPAVAEIGSEQDREGHFRCVTKPESFL